MLTFVSILITQTVNFSSMIAAKCLRSLVFDFELSLEIHVKLVKNCQSKVLLITSSEQSNAKKTRITFRGEIFSHKNLLFFIKMFFARFCISKQQTKKIDVVQWFISIGCKTRFLRALASSHQGFIRQIHFSTPIQSNESYDNNR